MWYLVRSCSALVLVAILAVGCAGTGASSPAPTATPTQAATNTPAPTPAPTARPTATPIPMTDGEGPEYVFGTSTLSVTKSATETVVGDVTQYRGQEMTGGGAMNDPRLAGTEKITLNADFYGSVASEWGTTRIENAEGTWEGIWTGVTWGDAGATSVSGWLVGSGAYAGWTYYFHAYGPSQPYQVEGIIFPGSPPAE
jgi:hypothetical protein